MKSFDDILNRNHRVELDKAWEVSYTRRAIIAGVDISGSSGIYEEYWSRSVFAKCAGANWRVSLFNPNTHCS